MDKLIKFAESDNLTGELNDTQLDKLAEDVLRRAEEDRQSMEDWADCVKRGLELCKPEFKNKSEPWDGAANYKSMIMAEAANDFGNRCKTELMRERDLVKTEITGQRTLKNVIERTSGEVSMVKERLESMGAMVQSLTEQGGQLDPQMQQQLQQFQQLIAQGEQTILETRKRVKENDQRADRVSEAMNWAVNNKMPAWRQDHCDMLYRLPLSGTAFKKTVYDETAGCYKSHVIMYPDFYVNQATTHISEARSFTHIIAVPRVTALRRIEDGLWRAVPLLDDSELEDADEGSDEAEGVEHSKDNPEKYYEQFCWYDMDDDGIEEPYIVTVHVASSQVVRIVARYNIDTIVVRSSNELYDFGSLPLIDAQRRLVSMMTKDAQELGITHELPDPDDLSGFELVMVNPEKILTKYGFMKSVDNTYLDVGLFHWIGPKTMGVNKATNDLLNAATIANIPGGYTAKGFRKKSGPTRFKPGEFVQTEIAPEQLQSSIWTFNFKEPSQTLFNLRDGMENESRGFVANIDQAVQSNTAPTTALAMVQEAMLKYSAHVSLVVDAMSEEFKILHPLIRDNLGQDEYVRLTGDQQASLAEDFSIDGLTIMCGANPEMSSKMQRMILAQAEMEQVPLVLQAGGNPIPILKNYFSRIGSENVDEIFPNEAEMSPEEKAQMQQMRAMQEQQAQMQQAQLQLTQLQTELLQREQDRKDFEAQSEAKERDAKIESMINARFKDFAAGLLDLEKAESEDVKNAISVYTARSNELTKAEQAAQRQADETLSGASRAEN